MTASSVMPALVAVLAACSSPEPSPSAPTGAVPAGSLPSAHVHGVDIDPGDGDVLVATHGGLLEVGDGGQVTPVGPVIDLMGFSVAGPDRYLASGHPGLRVDLPQPVGLIESTDGGRTWTPLSRQGQSDFHGLTASDAGVLGFDGALMRSADGREWEQLDIPVEPHSLAASPDGTHVLATTQQGLLRSVDAGSSWSSVDGAPVLQVVDWADGDSAVGVTLTGVVWSSTDRGESWQEAGRLDAAPEAVAASSEGDRMRLVVVTTDALVESSDGGSTFEVLLER
ncbi:F510_1955 family glycosylhydrolase [Blastococcus tunisiensis]|uniref:F510_1955 family glycosylhydrolase n=1 Tax=Blastococcus tunisiensis TaxID=1798228 RepID=UPI0020C8F98B|nr:exo-alpha-sialidase [Blastococcus sp. DSM 46838]